MKRKIIKAKTLGFCGGVNHAISLAKKALDEQNNVYSYGPMVHNPRVLQELESLGLKTHKPGKPLPSQGGTMVIRAHGISPVERKKLIDNAFNIVDGTCAKVLRSQEIISRYSSEDYFILIAGDLGHAEVLALQGCAEQSLVITSAEQVIPLKLHEKTLLIAQTTFSVEEYDKISTALGKKGIPFMVEKTICGATESRQKALDDLLPNIDALVVIGGLSSANTTRLYQRGLEMGKPSFLIEGPEDLDLNALEPYGIIGISAGASTPNGIIDETMDLLEDF